ncbi:hypothetical protein NDU88_011427 [Pleurodeles waltl]|uniref:Uncharacterized protein n=1 Tax=Pleurodeles waltl TaxID=8319 RepID=A0AAV7Q503_PLEWA|nr:hypothetical protein NDU88_011427 [Pleurodeles waltl]
MSTRRKLTYWPLAGASRTVITNSASPLRVHSLPVECQSYANRHYDPSRPSLAEENTLTIRKQRCVTMERRRVTRKRRGAGIDRIGTGDYGNQHADWRR